MSLIEDLEKEHWPNFIRWRKGPYLLALAAVVLLLVGLGIDAWWMASLTPTRCTVLSAKIGGEIDITPGTRAYGRHATRGRWVAHSDVEFQIEGAGPRRSIQGRTDFKVGEVLNCWVTRRDVFLNPMMDRYVRQAKGLLPTFMIVVLALVWGIYARRLSPVS